MDEIGIIHDNLERKILFLYILRRLPCEVELSSLFELYNNIDGIDYFAFTQCCYELTQAELVTDSDGYVSITSKGTRNVENVETSLPYSVRVKADDSIEEASDALKRYSLIKAECSQGESGWTVKMSLNDGAGELISMQVLCADKADASKIRSNFREGAEKYYNQIMSMLTE